MLKCDPRAWARCPDRKVCASCSEDACFAEGSDCHRYNLEAVAQPMTIADRIRAMTDEELCELLMGDPICDQKTSPDCGPCETCIMAWLRQPVEVTDG